MKIIDISQEIFTCAVYPDDRRPERLADLRMDRGDGYNLTSFQMCAHNGTHVDAPFHFLPEGGTAENIPLEKTVGPCYVTVQEAELDAEAAERILNAAAQANPLAAKRILIKGKGLVTEAAARVFAAAKLDLIGVEGLSVGPEEAPKAVHQVLLREEVVLLEGLRLDDAEERVYFLSAAPLNLSGSDGAPCRAILIDHLI